MYIHVGAESAQIYTGMGARACMVKKSECAKLGTMLSVYCIRCILIYIYMYLFIGGFWTTGQTKADIPP